MSVHAAEALAGLFAGFSGAHIRFRPEGVDHRGKRKGKYVTVHSAAGIEEWEQHIAGVAGLGIIPLLDDGCSVLWAAIDIDDLAVDHVALAAKVDQIGLPLIICRSKSGGAHAYIFFAEPEDASETADLLGMWIRTLGVSHAEIFPKQRRRIDPSDVGSALNMPYFGGNASDRYAIDAAGKHIAAMEFISLAAAKTTTLACVSNIAQSTTLFPDGPPCLQFIESNGGFLAGMRNNCMLNAAIYLQKRGDVECDGLDDINQAICEDPLDADEVANIISSVKRRRYEYTCKTVPLSSFCNRSQCLSRAYGVGQVATRAPTNGGAMRDSDPDMAWPIVDEVTLHQAEDFGNERWYLTVHGRRFRLKSEEITSQSSLSRLFLSVVGKRPPSLTQKRFDAYLNNVVFANIGIVPPDEIESNAFRFKFHIDRFIGQRATTETMDGLKTGIPYICDGMVWFHTETLISYLSVSCPDLSKRHEDLFHYLNSIGATKRRFDFSDGSKIRAWGLPAASNAPVPAPPDFAHHEEF